jgi:hypothetical protein
MKRGIFIIALALICALASPVFAMDYIIGAKGGYFTWIPYVKQIEGGGLDAIDKGEGALYGPVASIMFTPDLSLSVAALFGTQSTHWYAPNKVMSWESGGSAYLSGNYFMDADRIDIDSALSYRVSESFKVFAGYKYQMITVKYKAAERRSGISSSEETYTESGVNIDTPAQGPALGLGYSLPLGQSFFFTANLSALYMIGKFDMHENKAKVYDVSGSPGDINTFTYDNRDGVKLDSKQYGFNFEPSLGARIGDTGVIATVGIRVQYMRLNIENDTHLTTKSDWVNDTLYGLFVSVLYSF